MMSSLTWPSTHLTLLHRLHDSTSEEGWSEFCSVYSPLIYGFCRNRSLSHDDALDVSQNTLMELRCGIASFDKSKGRFRGWCGQITRRAIIDFKRKESREKKLEENTARKDSINNFEEDWDTEYRTYIVKVAIDRIRCEFETVEWFVWEEVVVKGRKPADVAIDANRTPAWVYRAKYRITQRLKAEVRFLDGDEAE